ncbi:ATP-binding protein [Flavobacterium sp.]|uniref:GAF domain-containing sensor histidine kinase n=1 Tax=Flavobacterium sp. TaxID=239 RepID=UPI0024889A74|nr:ATP-binding protein [Flavobacterium sp.]MDI1316350.1 ATP-binding protein [Flavobacterium sp.]
MTKALLHQDEEKRLKLLKSFCIFDSNPEKDFDNITAIASQICDTPIALISLLDENRQWFKSHHGLNVSETPKDYSFCDHAINQSEEFLIVEDARNDERFYDNPLVTGEPYIVFYAGVVLKNEQNLPFGTLCVIDQKLHTISKEQIKLLKALANQVVYLMENRRNKILLDSTLKKLKEKTKQSRIKEIELKLIHQNIPITLFQLILNKNKTNYFSYISNSFKKTFPIELPLNDINWIKSIHFYPDDYELLLNKLNKLDAKSEDFNFIGRFLANNEIIWFEINSNVIFKNSNFILDGTIKNITTTKNLEDDLRKKTIFNDLVLNNIPADIALFDKDHNYLFINQNGIKNDEIRKWLIGKNDFDYCDFKGIDATLAQVRRNYFNEAIRTKKQVDWIDEINKEGSKTYIFRRFYPFFIEGIFVYMIGYGIDVTELKQTQNDLDFKNQILINKNNELERFAYVASHDLQEPLLSILGYSNLLEDDYYEKLDNDGKIYLNFIKKSVTRMRNLITALMEYSRIEKKEILSLVDFNHLLTDVKEDLSNKINEYNAHVAWENLPALNCYPTFIRILLQNLISNAIKFTSKNTIPKVTISCIERESDWLFQVQDNGVGIDSKNFGEIFLIFKRLHNDNDYAGNGIGLAHCKKIIEIHDGNIWVESTPEIGSTFYFTISKYI